MSTRIEEEERVLRHWAPIILRAAVLASAATLTAGLLVMWVRAPDEYVARFRAMQHGNGHLEDLDTFSHLFGTGDPRRLLLVGLYLLTLVPLGRVAFTFVYFLKKRDWPFVLVTAIVLLLLGVGIAIGHVG
jgi:uncharacterized membrane protein